MSLLCNTTLLGDLVKFETGASYCKILSSDPRPLMNGQCGPPTKKFAHPWPRGKRQSILNQWWKQMNDSNITNKVNTIDRSRIVTSYTVGVLIRCNMGNYYEIHFFLNRSMIHRVQINTILAVNLENFWCLGNWRWGASKNLERAQTPTFSTTR